MDLLGIVDLLHFVGVPISVDFVGKGKPQIKMFYNKQIY